MNKCASEYRAPCLQGAGGAGGAGGVFSKECTGVESKMTLSLPSILFI